MSPIERPEYLSPSSIETFEQCPLKYKLSRIDKLESLPTDATLLGNFVHSVLEELLRLPPSERTFKRAQELLSYFWAEDYEQRFTELDSEQTPKSFKWKAYWCVENYFKMEDPTKIVPAGVEEEIDIAIGGIKVRGFIDRWEIANGSSVVIDYKTGKTPAPWYQDGKFKQLAIYAVGLSLMKDVPPGEMRLLFVKDRKVLKKTVTDEILQGVHDRITEVDHGIRIRIETGNFEPKTSKLCDWCDYKGICPAWN